MVNGWYVVDSDGYASKCLNREDANLYCKYLELNQKDIKVDHKVVYLVELTDELKQCLFDAKRISMHNTMAARIPECGDFGAIAQNLAYICQEFGIESEEEPYE